MLVRYLKGERQWIQVFELKDMSSEVTVFSDSDWAGHKKRNEENVKARESRWWDDTFLEAYTSKQKIIARSSARSRTVCSGIGRIRSEGGPEHDVWLGCCSETSVDH